MNWEMIGTVAEIVGASTVVVSIIYLSLQIRQHNRTTQAATSLDGHRIIAEWHRGVSQAPGLALVFFRGMEDPDSLSEDEKARFNILIAELYIVFDGLYRQYELGFLTEEAWLPIEKKVFEFLDNSWVQNWWASEVALTSEGFREFVNLKSGKYDSSKNWGVDIAKQVKVNSDDVNDPQHDV